jgi:hypothetical protein
MNQHSDPRPPARRPVGGELIIPIAAVAFTLYYFTSIIDSPFEAQVNAFFVGSILLGLVAVLLAIGYVAVIAWLGFTLTTFAFLSAAMLTLNDGRRPGFVLGLAAALALGGYLLFIVAFQTRFPVGPFERLMGALS